MAHSSAQISGFSGSSKAYQVAAPPVVFRYVKSLKVKEALGFGIQLLMLGVFLFGPAGTLHWWRAWAFLGIMVCLDLALALFVFPRDPGLLDERLKGPIQEGQPLADKIVLSLFLVSYVAETLLIPLDVFRYHLLPKPSPIVSGFGLVPLLVGARLMYLAVRENSFAAPVVKHQEERHQRVIDSGPYAIVRHPMYAGFLGVGPGLALWLQSYAGAVASLVLIGLLAVRIHIEERLLAKELEGYDEYRKRVRFRLVPGVW